MKAKKLAVMKGHKGISDFIVTLLRDQLKNNEAAIRTMEKQLK